MTEHGSGDGSSGRESLDRELHKQFGRIDIYLFDQLLRGRIRPSMRVLDAGCGPGRNSHYLMRRGAAVYGIDESPEEIERVRSLAARVAADLPPANFQVGALTALPFGDAYFDCVICNAVLHFARDEAQFERMIFELWRVLAPDGVFFARLATTIGIEDRVRRKDGRWHSLPDGTDRFLVIGGDLLDPVKTTNVQNLRAMTTWVLRKT